MRTIGIALLGCGVVGSEVARLLLTDADELAARTGARLELRGIAVRRLNKPRTVPTELLTTDAAALVARDDVDVVVEVVGGIEPVFSLLLGALRAGTSVVTANKALLAEHTAELAEAADASGADLCYEAAVAGAIPILRPLRESLAGDRITRVTGIVNGTTNFILSAMDATGAGYAETLEEAGRLGYAEADPTADVDGFDAAAKAAILASLAFHTRVTAADVHREGIRDITAADLAAARALDCTVKLLALCERVTSDDGTERVSARVYPAMVPRSHPLAAIDGAYNAVVVESEAAGRLMFSGPGAGGAPTASAVLGDLVSVGRNLVQGGRGPRDTTHAALAIAPMGDTPTRYHVSLEVADRAGVLAAVAGEFSRRGISISVVRQQGRHTGAQLVAVTHTAPDAALAATVAALHELEHVTRVTSVLRVEGGGES